MPHETLSQRSTKDPNVARAPRAPYSQRIGRASTVRARCRPEHHDRLLAWLLAQRAHIEAFPCHRNPIQVPEQHQQRGQRDFSPDASHDC